MAQDAQLDALGLDGEWRFLLAPSAAHAERFTRFHEQEFDAAAFTTIPVPSNWMMQGFEDPRYVNGTESEGFYLHTFAVPEGVGDRRVLLHFGGVWQSAEVWLNGRRLGRHDSGFTGFAFEATAAIKPGAENRLAVRVRQQTKFMKLDCNDDWALAGIYRGVWLQFTPKRLWLDRVEVQTRFDTDYRDAELSLRVFIARHDKGQWVGALPPWLAPSPPFEVRATLSTPGGETVRRETFTGTITGNHNGRDVPMTMTVRAPAQWTAETPNLYDLRVELATGGQTIQTWNDRIGFREVSTAGGVLRINGSVVKLRGVCRHDLEPDTGRATRPERWRAEIALMKAANINAVRLVHYPHAEGFVRLCDEMGLYVLAEIPFGFGGELCEDPSFAGNVLQRVHETVERDRNRPSVIIWDIGNEDPFTPVHLAAARALKGFDPTRPALLPLRAEEELPPEIDILAPHYWTAEEYDILAARSTRPIVTTEYTHALGPDDFGELQERWDALTRHPSGAGGMIWMWADQGLRRPINGRPVYDPMRDKDKYTRDGQELVLHTRIGPNEIIDAHGNLGTDGIVDPDLTPQRDYWETKAVYAPVRVLADRIPFQPGQESVSIPLRNDYDFTDLATVGVAWTLYRDGEALASGEAKVQAPPRTATALVVPTEAIAADAPRGVHYLHLVFTNAAGLEITRRSVRLGWTPAPPEPQIKGRVTAEKQGDTLLVRAGDARYAFDAQTGELAALDVSGKGMLRGTSIVVWRSPTWCERNVIDRRERVYPWDSFLQNLPGVARAWRFAEEDEGVRVTATTEYRADERNTVTVDYTYRVTPAGALKIDYVVTPRVDIEWLPEIGIALKPESEPQNLSWLGLGLRSSLPNKTAAALFGQWSAAIGSAEANGTKSGVEWLRLTTADGRALEVKGCVGFRWEQDLRIFSHLAGAWTKGGKPERREWRLDLTEESRFKGSFELLPLPAG